MRRFAAFAGYPLVALVAFTATWAASLPAARAVTLTLREETTPYAGVTIRRYRTASPATNTWVARIDLCQNRVHVDATETPSALETPRSWGLARGVQLATNGDFYRTGPVRVYGNAVGTGVPWPIAQTGLDPAYADEWYYKDFGWIAFGFDWVDFTHTKWVKRNWDGLQAGYAPGEVVTTIPAGTLGLVSGFPELVIEGTQYTCSSPTADDCFPDRSDMRDRHPRTAMGLTADRQTLLLVVVDGRTSDSAGMYGAELAELLFKLDAWQAFNLDGGGSSQMWLRGEGVLNDADGNNTGGGERSVANHWGIFAGSGTGMPVRPGHCVASAPCGVIPPEGGIVEETGPCFQKFGDPDYWRSETVGHGGGLFWTNAFQSSAPDNWAWWNFHFAEAGRYELEIYGHPDFAVFNRVRYDVQAAGATTTLTVDQSQADGWYSLGTFDFAAGGRQFLRVFDNLTTSVPTNQHIAVDAVRLTREGPRCGDLACEAPEDCATCPADCDCGCGHVCEAGQCAFTACAGLECGPDGCGGDCGTCPPWTACEAGHCEPTPVCGDGHCEGPEDADTCPADCAPGPECGDGLCEAGEDAETCPADCAASPECGDGHCEAGEDAETCPADCFAPPVCGDGYCEAGEDAETCPADCFAPPVCGDGYCEAGEDAETCPGDCDPGPECGDGICYGIETPESCPADCVAPRACGDGRCDGGEDAATCPADCGAPPVDAGGDAAGDAGNATPDADPPPDAGGFQDDAASDGPAAPDAATTPDAATAPDNGLTPDAGGGDGWGDAGAGIPDASGLIELGPIGPPLADAPGADGADLPPIPHAGSGCRAAQAGPGGGGGLAGLALVLLAGCGLWRRRRGAPTAATAAANAPRRAPLRRAGAVARRWP